MTTQAPTNSPAGPVPGLEHLTVVERALWGGVLSRRARRQTSCYREDLAQYGTDGAASMTVARFAMAPVPVLAALMIVGSALSNALLAAVAFGGAAILCSLAMARNLEAAKVAHRLADGSGRVVFGNGLAVTAVPAATRRRHHRTHRTR
jgi:hypothetical protein